MIRKLMNVCDDGRVARTLLSGCYKFGWRTLLSFGGASMTFVVEIYGKKKKDEAVHDCKQLTKARCESTSESTI